jgi:hypothetical protein
MAVAQVSFKLDYVTYTLLFFNIIKKVLGGDTPQYFKQRMFLRTLRHMSICGITTPDRHVGLPGGCLSNQSSGLITVECFLLDVCIWILCVRSTGLMSKETKDWSKRHLQFPVAMTRYSKFSVSTMGRGPITYA